MSLLLFHSEFPFLSDFHVIVLEPQEILSEAPVRGKNLISYNWELSEWNVFIDIPIFLVINLQAFQPASFDLTNDFLDVLELL